MLVRKSNKLIYQKSHIVGFDCILKLYREGECLTYVYNLPRHIAFPTNFIESKKDELDQRSSRMSNLKRAASEWKEWFQLHGNSLQCKNQVTYLCMLINYLFNIIRVPWIII